MSYNYVTVKYTYQTTPGTVATGRVEWYPTGPIEDTTNHLAVDEPAQAIILDSTGSFSVSLLATDNPGLSEFGWTLTPYVNDEEQEANSYVVEYANGSTQYLDQLTTYVAP